MMNKRKQKIEVLFQAALELDSPDQRASFLDRMCAGEPALRAEVEELLRAAEAAEPLFQSHERARATDRVEPGEPIQERPGSIIGRYKLLELIGEGGMGVVYMAEQQEPVRRRVAFKIIKLGMDTRQVVARFEAERQALALMDHPHIAKVLDGGATDTGRPYFVMELVQGVPITRFCDRNQLSTGERLKLFIPVCQAVQHAHQKGIIHRDLKPTNVLVTLNDGVPHPMIIDFGVAKAINQKLTEKTLFTNFATMIGTPAYMSPEQAEMSKLDVDTRSDIYSLGVLLYELLTGATPFPEERLRGAGYVEMQRIICEEEPEKPSTKLTKAPFAADQSGVSPKSEIKNRKSKIENDLDWIVMKCLAKDRTRRYETANGLGEDLRRHLNNEPVLARPPSRLYEFQKSVRRHKVGFAATAVIILVLAGGVLVSTWQAVRATRAKAQAVVETERAHRVTDFMRQMLATADPSSSKSPNYTVRAMLDDFAPAIDVQFPHDPEVAAELHTVIGAAYWSMQEGDKARTQLARALELRAAVYGTNSAQYADSLVDYANASDAKPEEREKSLRQALAIYQERGIRGEPVIHALWALQMLYDGERRLNEIEPLVLAAQAEARQSPGSNYWEIPAMNNGLIAAKIQQGKYAEAEKIARQTLAENNRLFGTDYIESAWVYGRLSEALVSQAKYAESLAAAQQAVAIMRKRISPDQTWYGIQLSAVLDTLTAARSAGALTNLFSSADQLAKVEALFQERLGSKPLLPDENNDPVNVATRAVPQFPGFYLDLADELSAAGRTNEAAECRRNAAALRTQLETRYPDKPDLLAQVYLDIIPLSVEQGELDEAKAYRQKLLALKHLNPASLDDLAWMLSTAAEPELRDGSNAIVFAEQAVAATGRTNTDFLNTLAAAYAESGQFDKAIATEKEAIALLPRGNTHDLFVQRLSLLQSSVPNRYNVMADSAHALLLAGRFAEAESESRTCLALREKLIPDDWRTFNAQSMLGACLLGQKKYAEAEPLLLSGYEGLKQREDKILASVRQLRLREALERLVQLYQATGQREKATEWKRRLDELNSSSAH
jgi:eukaryotic-like serine/threonine-protein kinase